MVDTVSFPGLGLEFELDRVAVTIFGKDIYWYGVIIAFGFLLAVAYGWWRAPRFAVNRDKLMDMLFFAVPLSILGARAYYVIFYPALYTRPDGSFDWGAAVRIWDGGLAIYGAVIMAVLTVAVYCKVRKEPFWSYADIGCFGLLIGQMIGRWGNFVNVEAYGGETTLPWRMGVTHLGAYMEVHPTFLYESLWNLLGFILLAWLARRGRRFDGQLFLSYVVWYGVGRAMIEGLRSDSLYFFGTALRTSQLLGLVSAVAALAFMAYRFRTAPPATPPADGGAGDPLAPVRIPAEEEHGGEEEP